MGTTKAKRGASGTAELKQLELEAFRAVSGGDFVRSRLLHGLALGNPNVEKAAYLIKSRVKRVDSLLLKVLDRRKKPKTKNYRPSDATDIVGLRLLTLFRNELPLLVRRFLDFVQVSQQSELGLFVGKSIRDSVQEIRIYGSSLRDDPNIELCVREFMDFGFDVLQAGKVKAEDVQVIFDRKRSEYSSIHIVLLANGPLRQNDMVPVEVQLRTSLEDVWGEIDHRIVYKEKNLAHSGSDTSYREREIESIRARVRHLKGLLDVCSNHADLIESDINRPVPLALASDYVDLISIGVDRLKHLPVDEHIGKKLEKATDLLRDFASKIGRTEGPPPTAVDLLPTLGAATNELEEARSEYLALGKRASKADRAVRYRLGMEIALCYYWQAILLEEEKHPGRLPGVMDNARDAVRRSINEYAKLSTQTPFSRSAALEFRLANAIDLQGSEEYALSHYERAYRYLKDDPDLETDNYLRVRIPRQLGVALWKCAHRLERESTDLGNRSLSLEQEREYCLRALEVTLPIYGKKIVRGEFDRASMTTEQENVTTANNILYYAVAFLECGGTWDDLSTYKVTKKVLRRYLSEVTSRGVGGIDRIIFADTVRLAASHLGEKDIMFRAARKVVQLYGRRDYISHYKDSIYEKIIKEARHTLAGRALSDRNEDRDTPRPQA